MRCGHEAEGFQQGSFHEAAATLLAEMERYYLSELQNMHLIMGGRGYSWRRCFRRVIRHAPHPPVLLLENWLEIQIFRSGEILHAMT